MCSWSILHDSQRDFRVGEKQMFLQVEEFLSVDGPSSLWCPLLVLVAVSELLLCCNLTKSVDVLVED